ncbi:hypothetical protein SAMD00019534_092780 [Acytostelium subglobosum LB1]|uniref:hypothetical protein n=1 Tax=Acytostelium subglobosum LB1 TaxID=1410327 RepID=UPI000644DB18|nr:hypothetical protein SAMD00019534_092780 [Acytostelium subglobosum LB1]GAM26103.1 hypothetical protein SAMD00019534_092780 [Acytostelium subglobosum LB1]|eukprot:XP_012751146.1 hypothetical protein SAMD00019534_092780 [Acytostelium subglobosum LB1]
METMMVNTNIDSLGDHDEDDDDNNKTKTKGSTATTSTTLSVNEFIAQHQQQKKKQQQQQAMNRRSLDLTTTTSATNGNSPSKLARTLSVVFLSGKKPGLSRRSTLPPNYLLQLAPGAGNSHPPSPKYDRHTAAARPKSDVVVPSSSLDVEPTQPPSTRMQPLRPEVPEIEGHTTPDAEEDELTHFYQHIKDDPDGFIEEHQLRKILEGYDEAHISQIIDVIPFENGVCSNAIFLAMVNQFQANGTLDDDEYEDYSDHPINRLEDFQVTDDSKIVPTVLDNNGKGNVGVPAEIGDDDDVTTNHVESPSNQSDYFKDNLLGTVVSANSKLRKYDRSMPQFFGELEDNGAGNEQDTGKMDDTGYQEEIARLKQELATRPDPQRVIHLQETIQLTYQDLKEREQKIAELEKDLDKESGLLRTVEKKYRDISEDIERSIKKENEATKEVEELKKNVYKKNDELSKLELSNAKLLEQEELARKREEEREAQLRKYKHMVETSKSQEEQSSHLIIEQLQQIQQQEAMIKQQEERINTLIQQQQQQLHNANRHNSLEDSMAKQLEEIREMLVKIDTLEREKRDTQEQCQKLSRQVDAAKNEQTRITGEAETKLGTLLQHLHDSNRLYLQQLDNTRTFVQNIAKALDTMPIVGKDTKHVDDRRPIEETIEPPMPRSWAQLPNSLLNLSQYNRSAKELDISTENLKHKLNDIRRDLSRHHDKQLAVDIQVKDAPRQHLNNLQQTQQQTQQQAQQTIPDPDNDIRSPLNSIMYSQPSPFANSTLRRQHTQTQPQQQPQIQPQTQTQTQKQVINWPVVPKEKSVILKFVDELFWLLGMVIFLYVLLSLAFITFNGRPVVRWHN